MADDWTFKLGQKVKVIQPGIVGFNEIGVIKKRSYDSHWSSEKFYGIRFPHTGHSVSWYKEKYLRAVE